MSDSPVIADRKPIKVELMKDEEYWCCTCGRSDNQPFCDGSHDGTAFQPMQFRAEQDCHRDRGNHRHRE